MSSFVLRGGTIVNPDGNFNADVVVRNGVIELVGDTKGDLPVIDATGCFVSSGFVDLHTHLR